MSTKTDNKPAKRGNGGATKSRRGKSPADSDPSLGAVTPIDEAKAAIQRGDAKSAIKHLKAAHSGRREDGAKVTSVRKASAAEIEVIRQEVALGENVTNVERAHQLQQAKLMAAIADDLGVEGDADGKHYKALWSPVDGASSLDTKALDESCAADPDLAARLATFRTVLDVKALEAAAAADPSLQATLDEYQKCGAGTRKLTTTIG